MARNHYKFEKRRKEIAKKKKKEEKRQRKLAKKESEAGEGQEPVTGEDVVVDELQGQEEVPPTDEADQAGGPERTSES